MRKRKPSKSEVSTYNTNYTKSRRAYITNAKSRPCVDCQIQYPEYVMQFDHVPNRGPKLFNIGAGFRTSIARLEVEIAKCDILCANCHCKRTHYRRGII